MQKGVRMITVYYNGKPYQYADSTKYLELARTLQPQFEHDIVLASVNGKLQELWKYIKDGASVSFLTTQSQAGIMAYRRSVVLLLLKALKDTISKERLGSNQVKVEFSLSKGLFCHFDKGLVLDEEELKQVQTSMEILREANYPIEKYSISTEAAIEQFGKAKMTDKERLFRFRRASKVNIYSLDGLEDYYYGYMVPSTGYLKYFKLYSYEDGFVLQMPVREAPEVIPEFEPQHKLFKVMRETGKWGEELGVATVGELNELITGKTNKILLQRYYGSDFSAGSTDGKKNGAYCRCNCKGSTEKNHSYCWSVFIRKDNLFLSFVCAVKGSRTSSSSNWCGQLFC